MSARASTISAALALALAPALCGCGGASSTHGSASGFDGAELDEQPLAPGFTLTDQAGRRVSLASYRGRPLLLTFVYSTCGATCVLVAQQIRGALEELPGGAGGAGGAGGPPVNVLLVSADPRADTRASVARFLASVSLSGRAEYLTGPPAQLRRIWSAYRVTPPERDAKLFKRDAIVLLIDAQGRERVAYGLEQLTPEALAHDVGRLGGG